MGFGGTGISKIVNQEGTELTVEKSEGPGMLNVFLDRVMFRDDFVVGLEHSRGFRMGPFSSGVGFTAAGLRWHYLGPAPDPLSSTGPAQIAVRRWSPYTGGATGIALGTIIREGDRVKSVTSSGVTLGLKNGVDYLWRPSIALRIEVSYSFTFAQDPVKPAQMTEFSLWSGVFIPAF